jgi:hypothetical protein
MLEFNKKPLHLVQFSQIENLHPVYVAQSTRLDHNHNLVIWMVDDKYYATID